MDWAVLSKSELKLHHYTHTYIDVYHPHTKHENVTRLERKKKE